MSNFCDTNCDQVFLRQIVQKFHVIETTLDKVILVP